MFVRPSTAAAQIEPLPPPGTILVTLFNLSEERWHWALYVEEGGGTGTLFNLEDDVDSAGNYVLDPWNDTPYLVFKERRDERLGYFQRVDTATVIGTLAGWRMSLDELGEILRGIERRKAPPGEPYVSCRVWLKFALQALSDRGLMMLPNGTSGFEQLMKDRAKAMIATRAEKEQTLPAHVYDSY